MSIYEYQCRSCNLRFELKQSFNDKTTTTCPACHDTAYRLFPPVPILVKGPGFYITDSRAGGKGSFGAKGSGGSKSAW